MISESKRLHFLDALKGFAIILVVAGHLMIRLGISGYDNVLWTFIVSLHLPLFFFVSGYFAENKVSRLNVIAKKAQLLLLPGIIFFILYTIYKGGSPLSFLKYGFQEYWFTFVLFEMFLIYFLCSSCFGRLQYVLMIILSILGIGFLMAPTLRGGGRIDTILCLENLAKYLQFFTLGICCKKYNSLIFNILQKDFIKATLLILYIISFYICFNTSLQSNCAIIYKLNHDIIFKYLGVFVILSFFIYKAVYFQSNMIISRSMVFIGQRTLDIYLIHYFLLPSTITLPESLKSNSAWYFQLLILLVLTITVIGGSLLISNVIRMSSHMSTILLGARKTKKSTDD